MTPAAPMMDSYQPALALSGGGIVSPPMGKPAFDENQSTVGLMGSDAGRPEASQPATMAVSSGVAREVVSMDRLIRAIRESDITVRFSKADPSQDDGADLRVFDETSGRFVPRPGDHGSYVIDLGPLPLEAHLEGDSDEVAVPMGLEEGAMAVPGPSWLSILKRFGRGEGRPWFGG